MLPLQLSAYQTSAMAFPPFFFCRGGGLNPPSASSLRRNFFFLLSSSAYLDPLVPDVEQTTCLPVCVGAPSTSTASSLFLPQRGSFFWCHWCLRLLLLLGSPTLFGWRPKPRPRENCTAFPGKHTHTHTTTKIGVCSSLRGSCFLNFSEPRIVSPRRTDVEIRSGPIVKQNGPATSFFFPPFRFCCRSLLPAGSRRFVDALRSNDDGAKNQKNKIKQKASGRDRPDDRWSVCVTLGLGLLTTDSLVVVLLFFFGQRPPRNEHKRRVSGGWRFSFIFFFARAPPPPPSPRTPSGQPDASTFVGRKTRDRK